MNLQEQWACLECFAKFSAGKLRVSGGHEPRAGGNRFGLNCPECRSMNVHPADGGLHRMLSPTDGTEPDKAKVRTP